MDVRPAGGKTAKTTQRTDVWEKKISRIGKGGAYVYSDGSLLDGGNVCGRAFVVEKDGKEMKVGCRVGDVATVWNGEVAGMVEGLARVCRGEQVLILAVILAVRKAGKTGGARS